MLGNGNGTFRTPLLSPPVRTPKVVFAADLTGDGIQDMVVENLTTPAPSACCLATATAPSGSDDFSTGGVIRLL